MSNYEDAQNGEFVRSIEPGRSSIRRRQVEMTPDGRLDRKSAAIYLGVTESCLAERQRKGLRPKSVKVCNRRFYFKTELDALIAGEVALGGLGPRHFVVPVLDGQGLFKLAISNGLGGGCNLSC